MIRYKVTLAVFAATFVHVADPAIAQEPISVDQSIFEDTDEPLHTDTETVEDTVDLYRLRFREQQKALRSGDLTLASEAFSEIADIPVTVGDPTFSSEHGLGIYIFDIGQADSMLIVGPTPERRALLVDLGVSNKGEFTGRKSLEHVAQRIASILGRTHIDYFMISHFHKDHYGTGVNGFLGLLDLIQPQFTIGTMIDTGDLNKKFVSRSATTRGFKKRVNRWKRENKLDHRERPKFGDTQIDLGDGVSVDIIAFAGKLFASDKGIHRRFDDEEGNSESRFETKPASENDLSIAFEVTVGDFEFWSAGDFSGDDGRGDSRLSGSGNAYTNLEEPMVDRWINRGRESDVEIYRSNHHGAKYSNTPALLNALDPEFVLYSAESGHKHPNPLAVKRSCATAWQVATGIDMDKWLDVRNFEGLNGIIVDEIQIMVAKDGASYTLNGEVHPTFSDEQELSNEDVLPDAPPQRTDCN